MVLQTLIMGSVTGLIAAGLWLAAAYNPWGSDESHKLADKAQDYVKMRDFDSAHDWYLKGYEFSISKGLKGDTGRFLMALGGTEIGRYRYRDALAYLLDARKLALELKDTAELGGISSNLASVYLQMENIDAAEQTAHEAIEYHRKSGNGAYLPQMLYLLGSVASRRQHPEESFAYYAAGIDKADRAGNDAVLMVGANRLANDLVAAGRYKEAEPIALAVYRHRFLRKDADILYCYPILATIEMKKGNFEAARHLSDIGLKKAKADPRGIPLQAFYEIAAKLMAAQGNWEGSYRAYVDSVRSARRWRLGLMPTDDTRTAGESSLGTLYDKTLETAARLYFDNGKQSVIQEAWLETADWRAASLRQIISKRADFAERIDPEYWKILARYRKLDTESVLNLATVPTRGLPTNKADELGRLRLRLGELESYAGIAQIIDPNTEISSFENPLIPYRKGLQGSQVLISFELGENVSHRWVLSPKGLSWQRLPARATIARLSQQFRNAVEQGSGSARELGRELGEVLFANLEPDAEMAKSWLLTLDDSLFQVPLAALVRTSQGSAVGQYLIERHSLMVLPGAWSLLNSGTSSSANRWKGGFVGVADAIYNSADPRQGLTGAGSDPRSNSGLSRTASGASSVTVVHAAGAERHLPRLVSSQLEVQSAANAWGSTQSPAMLLTGARANRNTLLAAIQMNPAILHFATHIIRKSSAPDQAYIALSLTPEGTPELLSATDIARYRVSDSLVVLSGCYSANGSVQRGSGLIGLIRSWLMSGASSVVATLWPTPDEPGSLFESFYRELRNQNRTVQQTTVHGAAEALRLAQLEMLRTNSWRAQPKYWAAYLLTGRAI